MSSASTVPDRDWLNPHETCCRCTRPALFKIKGSYAVEHNVRGYFCGRHAAKCGMPTVGCTLASAGFGAYMKPKIEGAK